MQNCTGAINGIHVKIVIPQGLQVPYIERKGYPTQNILAACDFDMYFTYVLTGWERSAHGIRIFYETIRENSKNFPMPQGG